MRSCKILVAIVAVLLTFAFLPSLGRFELANAADANFLVNGGFESGLAGWTRAGDGLAAVTEENARSGNSSLKVSSSLGQRAYLYQFVDFPYASYTFTFWIYRSDPRSWTSGWLSRDWDGNTARVVSSLVIQPNDTIRLDAWDIPYAPGQQEFDYDFTVGVWHNVTFGANATSGTQGFYIDGNLIQPLSSRSGNVFNPDVLMFGDVSTRTCNGTFYFDDFKLEAVGEIPPPPVIPQVSLEPAVTTIPPNSFFAIQAKVENVTNLYSWQLELFYSNDIIGAINATEGPFLNSSGPTTFLKALDDNYSPSYGRVVLAGSFLGVNPGVNGSGILATIVFKAIAPGNSDLYAQGAGTMLLDPQGRQVAPINVKNGLISVSNWSTDLNGDRKVDIRDIVIAALAYGSYPGHPRWTPIADLNKDSFVDIRDIAIIAKDFGKTL